MRVDGGIVNGVAAVLQTDRFLSAAGVSLGFVIGIVTGIAVPFDIVQFVSSILFFRAVSASNKANSS